MGKYDYSLFANNHRFGDGGGAKLIVFIVVNSSVLMFHNGA